MTAFTAGDLVISISGDGDGSGTYTDNQATPAVLQELTTTGTIIGTMVLPQQTMVVNGVTEYALSSEYGSSSEGTLQLSADGQSLVIAGYGINAGTFNAGGAAVYGNAALAQSTSVLDGKFTAVPRVIADISYNGVIDTSTALYNVFNTNNPRSVATVNGTTFYVSGQGVKGDTTQGVFFAHDGASNATSIDSSTDTRLLQINNGQLFVSRDSTQGVGGQISSYGTTLPTTATTPTVLPGISASVTLTAAQENTVNAGAVGTSVNLSPEQFFFASPTVLYVADGGQAKEGGVGDGGLQKWVFNGTSWQLEYTLSQGLNLVNSTSATSGTSGLIGLTGTLVGGMVELFATNSTIGDTDQTYLYGITDTLSATSGTGESFTVLETAAPDTNIRGVSFAPQAATVTTSNTSVGSAVISTGLTISAGSTLTVANGGTVVATTVMSGGSMTVSSGGVDSATDLAQGGTEFLFGAASGDFIGGVQVVSAASGAAASIAVITGEDVLNGGTVELLLKGAVATGATVEAGGEMLIDANATIANAVLSGGLIGLQSSKSTLSGSLTFINGGTVEFQSLTSAGSGDLAVMSGFGSGDAIDFTSSTAIGTAGSLATVSTTTSGSNIVATVSGGGATETLIFAGTTVPSELVLTSDGHGGEELVLSAPAPTSTTISSGVTSGGLLIANSSVVDALSGGTLASASIQSGGSATIEFGGIDSGSTLAAGGNELVLGSATGDLISGTQVVSSAGAGQIGVVSNETVFNGGQVDLFIAGSVGNGITVDSGGSIVISGRGTLEASVLNGGTLLLESPKATIGNGNGSIIGSTLSWTSGSVLEETVTVSAVSAGVFFGDQAVNVGFGAGDVIDFTSSTAIGLAGSSATLSTTTSAGNLVAVVSGGGSTESFTFLGTTLAGSLTLQSDGHGGEELVFGSGGTSSSSSGTSGTTLTDQVVSGGTTLTVSTGITAISTTVESTGSLVVAAGGIESAGTILAGGIELVLGSATGDQIFGTQNVSNAAAIVSNEVVFNGGSIQLLTAGAIANGITIDTGGSAIINGRGTLEAGVLNGGTLLLESAKATISGTLSWTSGSVLEETATVSAMSAGVFFGDQAVNIGFGGGDAIVFTSATAVGAAGSAATLTVSTTSGNTVANVSGGGSVESFVFAGTTIASDLSLLVTGGGVELVACFAAGTKITTTRGEIAVEDLRVGDSVPTVLDGQAAPITWIGRREVDCQHHPKPRQVWPVRISAGAFGEGRPHSDLLLSPDHAVYVGEVLIPVKHLINGTTIVQVSADSVTYYHIELPQHDVVLAQGLPAESYLELKDGWNYRDPSGAVVPHPDFVSRMWDALGCAPLVVAGSDLHAARALVRRHATRRDAA